MEHDYFDALARAVARRSATRRVAMRFLSGATMGTLAARLGLLEDAEAANKNKKQKSRRRGAVQGEGKRKKKRKKAPRPALCDLDCEEDGGRCCPGAGCVFDERCCPGEKPCGDGSCVGLRQCCPGEVPCRDGSCPAPGKCCAEMHQCADASCVDPLDECCPEQHRCGNGACLARDQCCPEAPRPPCSSPCGEVVCQEGNLVCRPRQNGASCGAGGLTCCRGVCYSTGCGEGRHFNPDNCRCECDVVQACPPGQAFSHGECACVCNCLGTCCLSGCCVRPDQTAYCCEGF